MASWGNAVPRCRCPDDGWSARPGWFWKGNRDAAITR